MVRVRSPGRARYVDARLRCIGVLKHQGGDSSTFTILQGLNNGVMLAVRVVEHFVHARKVDSVERDRVRGRERNPTVAFNRFSDDLAPGSLHNQRMELLVHLTVSSFVRLDEVTLGENLITLSQALVQGLDQSAWRPLLSKHARRQPLEHAANIDRVHDLLRRKGSDNEAAGIELGQDTFLREDRQGFTNGGSRNAELASQLNLPHPFTRSELSIQDHLANSYDYS